MTNKITRRLLREKVLQILYAYEMNNEGLQTLTEGVLADLQEESDKEFCRMLVNKVLVNKDELDNYIGDRVSNWELNRITIIDKILLRMGICEILHLPEIPPKVSINEVIEIAKNYSTPNSGKFINGVLDTVLNKLKSNGMLVKTGRGLIDETLQKKPTKKKGNEQ
ncbi:MAG: transcription antitermination factor NusB [Bacteroidota bacterium]|nr:transcription antitermination factor NusB [Bacteroidota bacterium]MDP4193340.1 transcription antitermination factor NusB [Bacteroidota bacterium]MDP4195099.1 transcription antitermination factor NusB [Bacteroidota bacterium]